MATMQNYDLTTESGRQEFQRFNIELIRNEINSYTKETQVSTISGASSGASSAGTIIVPTGIILAFAGGPGVTTPVGISQDIPSGWLLCSNVAVSRSAYSNLFKVIGTQYGVGDGSTTFNVPDLRGRAPHGKDNMGGTAINRVTSISGITGTTLGAVGGDQRIQDHTHTYSGTTGNDSPDHYHDLARAFSGNIYGWAIYAGGASYAYTGNSATSGASVRHQHAYSGTTANHNQTAGGASQNMPPTIITNYIIKT